jgi:hypothetical protein
LFGYVNLLETQLFELIFEVSHLFIDLDILQDPLSEGLLSRLKQLISQFLLLSREFNVL